MKNRKNKKAFTLAETLITLTILGVVAAITIPALIQKYIEATNRTKVKKAMAAYEKVISQLVVENNITGSIKSIFAQGNCDDTSKYFKAIRTVTGNKCRFQTSDRVWWDISDIEHPIIMLNDDYKNATLLGDGADTLESLAKSSDNKEVFGMVGTIEDGVVRINDKGVAEVDDATILNKTYAFMNNEKEKNNTTSGLFGTPYQSLEDFPECSSIEGDIENCKIRNNLYNIKGYYIYNGAVVYSPSTVDSYNNYDCSPTSGWRDAYPDIYDCIYANLPSYALRNCESFMTNCTSCDEYGSSCPQVSANGTYSAKFD